MAEKNASHAHNNPIRKIAEENAARIEQMNEQLVKLEHQGMDKMREAVDESAKLWKASFDLMSDISAGWRQVAVEASRRSFEMFSALPKA
jgi:hypothetical protein